MNRSNSATGAGALLLASVLCCMHSAVAETRGYVVSWFGTATNAKDYDSNCPNNRNGDRAALNIRDYQSVGYSLEEAKKLAEGDAGNGTVDPAAREARQKVLLRGRSGGKPVSWFNYPDTVPDPNIQTVTGQYAYGFDLGGPAEAKFIDPDTHQKVDNQLWRALGCTDAYAKYSPPVMPFIEELEWSQVVEAAPAWLIQITGENLNQDGPVTVTLDTATRHAVKDATGATLTGASYIVEPRSRSHNELRGTIRNGMLTIEPHDIYLESELPYHAEIEMLKSQMRLKLQSDGKLVGYWGGYQNWRRWMYMFTSQPAGGADTLGIFWALKKLADYGPDSKTGGNLYISGTYRLEAVPAYILSQDDKALATPVYNIPQQVTQTESRPAGTDPGR